MSAFPRVIWVCNSGHGVIVEVEGGEADLRSFLLRIDDTDVEDDETVIVTLAAGTGYTVGAPTSDTVTIGSEDDPTATLRAGCC